jgi:hypothetical protein
MAHMYGGNYFTEDSPAHHTLVLGEVQTMDCRMYRLPILYIPYYALYVSLGWFQVLFLDII